MASPRAHADITWQWSYQGASVTAGGTLTTVDVPDEQGFYLVKAITGQRNGDAITGLYPTGQAIPGNEPYALDNLVRKGADGQLTVHGLGYATASGRHANPFHADFLPTPGYLEVFTGPGGSFSELPITFSAAPVPEPRSLALLAGGMVVMAAMARRRALRG